MTTPLYLDHDVDHAFKRQLLRRGVDVITAQDDGAERLPDANLLNRTTHLDRLLFTHDIRFRVLAEAWQRNGRFFAGLAFGHATFTSFAKLLDDLELSQSQRCH